MLRRQAILALLALCTLSVSAQTKPADTIRNPQLLTKVEAYLRNLFAWDANYKVTLGPITSSRIPSLYKIPVTVEHSGQSETGTVYVTPDGHYMFRGEIRNLNEDPFAANRAKLKLSNSPSRGPVDAKVTIVEFSDFECPHCLELYTVLKTVLPEFPQIRFVSKNFPLTQIHPWAMTAALAGRCAYQSSPKAYWKMYDDIFQNQDIISSENAWDEVTSFATQAGLKADSFHACMIAPDTKAAVQADIAEGKDLGVDSTPTLFINGRPLVGGDRASLEQIIHYELARQAKH